MDRVDKKFKKIYDNYLSEHPTPSINYDNSKEVREANVYDIINLYMMAENKSDIKEAAKLVNEVKEDAKQLELWKYINKKALENYCE